MRFEFPSVLSDTRRFFYDPADFNWKAPISEGFFLVTMHARTMQLQLIWPATILQVQQRQC